MEYCLAYRSPFKSNSNEKRVSSSLLMQHTGNASGTVIMYDLITKATFRCDHFTTEPMPEYVIQSLRQLAFEDEPKNLRKRPPAWMLTRAVEFDEAEAAHDPFKDPNIRALVDVPNNRVEPALAADIDIEMPIGIQAPQAAGPAASSASDNGVANQPQASGSSRGNTANNKGDAAATEASEAEFESDDDVPDDDRDRFDRDNIDAYPQVVDEHIEQYDPPNYHQRDGRRVSRRREDRASTVTVRQYKMSLKKALSSNNPGVEESIFKELKQLVARPAWLYVDKKTLTKAQRRKLIRSHMFMKDKHRSDGTFDKWKARLVAGGDTQDKSIYDNLSSPTVCLDSVFTIIAIAACERRFIATIDITGAYLECVLPPDDEVYMVLDPITTRLLHQVDPKAAEYQTDSGETVVRLTRALYGCVQSALLWYNKLKETLEEDGFIANPYDMCVFNKMVKGKQITVAFHVDDLLVTSTSEAAIQRLISFLRSKFQEVTAETGDVHSYLAMTITRKRYYYTVSMDGYITSLVANRKLKHVSSPANDKLFEREDDPIYLSDKDKKDYHSDVAKVLFLAKRVKMTCLAPVSALASCVSAPTVEDRKKLDRVFNYIHTSRGQVMKYKVHGDIHPMAYVDASYATQPDGRSRTGILIKIAGCAIGAWSVKQKIVTRSSTEAELVALTEALTNIIWLRRFYEHQGYRDLPPTKLWEDNTSCIKLMTTPRHNGQRTKHLDIRYFYAKELQEQGYIDIKYVGTEDQQADLLSKGMVGTFPVLASRMTGNEE